MCGVSQQIAPRFGVGKGNVIFDGPGQDEDFGLGQVTANQADRYKFRSSPLRNLICKRHSSTAEHSRAWRTQSALPRFSLNRLFLERRDGAINALPV